MNANSAEQPVDTVESAAPQSPKAPAKRAIKQGKKTGRTLSRKGMDQRAQIMQAAFDCFSAVGYDNASTRAIAERAGASHTKILYHFGSKEDLWVATMDKAIGDYIDKIEADLGAVAQNSPGEALRVFIRDFVSFSAEFPGVHRIMSMESTQGTGRLDWLVERYLQKHFNTICNLIRLGQIEGTVRDGDPARLYYLIISAGAAPFTLSGEYLALTGRDVFSEAEIYQTIGFIYSVIFVDQPSGKRKSKKQ